MKLKIKKVQIAVTLSRSGININQSDVKSIARGELKRLQRDAKAASRRGNTLTRYHLQDVVDRIDLILDPK